MNREREVVKPQIQWWTPFIPEIKDFLKKINSIVEWYPKAYSEGKRVITTFLFAMISCIVIGLWILTFYDKISGDSFVFVIGTLLGYLFAFLQKFLGILKNEC